MVTNDRENKDFKFIINTFTKWDEPPRARHQVATEISKHYDTIFISANKTGLPKLKKKTINNNLSVIYPYFPITTKIRYRVPIINELYQLWLFSKLKKQYPDYYVINFDFTARLIYRFFTKTIFYCNDNFTAISKRINNILIYRYHLRCERTVAEKANFCIATSGILKNKILNYTDRVYEIPLGGPSIKEFDIKIKYEIKNRHSGYINVGLVGYI